MGETQALLAKKGKESQPPKKSMTVRALIRIMELYSARKNNAKPIAAYSTL